MKKLLFTTTLTIVAIWAGWGYLPPNVRNKLTAFVGAARNGDMVEVAGEAKRIFKATALPGNPEKRRTVLLTELKKNLEAIKDTPLDASEEIKPKTSSRTNTEPGRASSGAVVESSKEIIKKLEEANDDTSVTTKIIERVLERILPAQQCAVEEKK